MKRKKSTKLNTHNPFLAGPLRHEASKQVLLKSGFTVVEVVISISILIIGIVGIMRLFPEGLKIGRISNQMSIANNLVQSKIEETISNHYDDIQTGIIEPRAKVDSDPSPSNQFYIYEWQTEVDLIDADFNETSTNIGLKKITVNIWWQEQDEEKNIILKRIITEK